MPYLKHETPQILSNGQKTESVLSILGGERDIKIQNWLDLVEESAELIGIPYSRKERTGHSPKLL